MLQSSTTPCLCKPCGTEPHYTMSVWHVDKFRHTQPRCTTPQLTLVLQSPTTPCQFDMWKNADICGLHIPSPQSTPVVQSPTKPCQFDMWNNAHVPRWDVHPMLIEPSATEPYYTMSVWYVEGQRCTQVRCTPYPPTPTHIVDERSTTWCHVCICYVLLLFSLYSLWRFTCIEDSYKHYAHWWTLL